MISSLSTFKRNLHVEVNHALQSIESAYKSIRELIENEEELGAKDRNILYDYGMSNAKIHLVKLINAKKGLVSIIEGALP